MNDIFTQAGYPNTNTRASFLKLKQLLRKTSHGQKTLSHKATSICNNLLSSLKATWSLFCIICDVTPRFGIGSKVLQLYIADR